MVKRESVKINEELWWEGHGKPELIVVREIQYDAITTSTGVTINRIHCHRSKKDAWLAIRDETLACLQRAQEHLKKVDLAMLKEKD